MKPSITFLGAARNVTGSRYLLETGNLRLLVDCGLHQERHLKDRDYAPFPVPPETISAVLLTHAHLDHCGLLPRLVSQGFKGRIYCTSATAEIAHIVLLDSAHIQEEDAKYKARRHKREGRDRPAKAYLPLYTGEEAKAVDRHFVPVNMDETVRLGDGATAMFRNAGHILGASFVEIALGEGDDRRTIVFSGDVGRIGKPIIRDPYIFDSADYFVVESTYGNRDHHDQNDVRMDLAEVINETVKRGGNVYIPSFAVERAHEILYHLNILMQEERIPRMMVFLDSPMASSVTEVFERHTELYDDKMREFVRNGHSPFHFPELKLCRSVEESKAINSIKGSAIVIAGSGMCTGGRIKHHLAQNLGRSDCTVLFVGYQAAGTLGRTVSEGTSPVRVLGQEIVVRCRIARVHGFSAHADRNELLTWMSGVKKPPRRVFVTHGDDSAADAFVQFIKERAGWNALAPSYLDRVELDG